ncbi:MAG: inositol monophosphatase family protein, partial [Thermaurantiacus sp.]
LAGLPSWCVLIALTDDTGPLLSVIDQPYTGERFFGTRGSAGQSAFLQRAGVRTPLVTRKTAGLASALGETTDAFLFKGLEWDAFQSVRSEARLFRYGLDAYGYAMVAAGGLDFVMESELKAWDVAALVPVVEGAGGVVTNWAGGPAHTGGQVLASAHPRLHEEILALLAPAAKNPDRP